MYVEIGSYIRGHHVYSIIWIPMLEKVLIWKKQLNNTEDRYAVAIKT